MIKENLHCNCLTIISAITNTSINTSVRLFRNPSHVACFQFTQQLPLFGFCNSHALLWCRFVFVYDAFMHVNLEPHWSPVLPSYTKWLSCLAVWQAVWTFCFNHGHHTFMVCDLHLVYYALLRALSARFGSANSAGTAFLLWCIWRTLTLCWADRFLPTWSLGFIELSYVFFC